jgi:mycofactocin biosynthetic radical S-adenosylmethionine protein MftC
MAGSGLAQAKQRALRLAQPLSVHLELTYVCNWRCVFCYNPRHNDHKRLSVPEWERVFDELRQLGALTLTLTGGEPLAHPEFFAIAGAARRRAFALRIFTNGSLITEEVADRIAALRPSGVELSLHGATAAVHDRATGRPGSFDALFAGVDRLTARQVALVLKTPLTALNEHELDAMIEMVAARGHIYRLDPVLTPKDDGDKAPLAYTASTAAVGRLMKRMKDVGQLPTVTGRTEGGVNCGLGRLTMAIDPEGNVYPCLQWRQSSLGNVRQQSLLEMWQSPARAVAAQVARDANDVIVRLGEAAARFPYCPALAFQETGDPLTPGEPFLHQAGLAAALR